MNEYKSIPIGMEDFKEVIDKNCYLVDKTLLIKDILDGGAKVTLFTRPRRFGKTLNMSMLRRFFEKTEEDHSYLMGWQSQKRATNTNHTWGSTLLSAFL